MKSSSKHFQTASRCSRVVSLIFAGSLLGCPGYAEVPNDPSAISGNSEEAAMIYPLWRILWGKVTHGARRRRRCTSPWKESSRVN